jgi:hypothetical protein
MIDKQKRGIQGETGKQGKRGIRGIKGEQGIPGISNNYIDAKTFEDFCFNQGQLIDILNHRMTAIELNIVSIKTDVAWTKKILWAILGVGIASIIAIVLKPLMG